MISLTDTNATNNTNPVDDKNFNKPEDIKNTKAEPINEAERIPNQTVTSKKYQQILENDKQIISSQKDPLSTNYLSHKTKQIIHEVMDYLKTWETNGTEESLVEITEIKKRLDNIATYLQDYPSNRVLVGMLRLIFDNNNWMKMNTGQINVFHNELKRFQTGYVSQEELVKFSQQLFRTKVLQIGEEVNEEE